jgi:dynactin complex subunit
MSKKWNLLKSECTLTELGIKLMVMKLLHNNLKMLLMLFFILRVDQDIINEHHDKLVQLWHEYEVHQVHQMCRSIGESKRHNQILIQSVPGRECSLRNVFWTDLDLMITRPNVDLGEDLTTGKLIKKNVDAGQRIFVLDSNGIQGSIINT